MADDPTDSSAPPARQRGMIPRGDLPFLPSIRWRFWAPVLIVVLGAVATYFAIEFRRGRAARRQLLAEHAVLTEALAPSYRDVRAKLGRLGARAAGAWEGPFIAPGFTLATLSNEPVLYGRVRAPEIHRPDDFETSIRHRYPDQLASCLGLEMEPVPRFYSLGDFLMPAYIDSVRGEGDAQRLQYLRQDLEFRLRRDTPELVRWSRLRYFALAVDEADASVNGPTRLYIWDLRTSQPVLRVRATGDETIIIPVRIAGMPGGGRPVPQPTNHMSLSQHDCAVANEARTALGVEVLSLHSAPAVLTEPTDAGPDAASADAASPHP